MKYTSEAGDLDFWDPYPKLNDFKISNRLELLTNFCDLTGDLTGDLHTLQEPTRLTDLRLFRTQVSRDLQNLQGRVDEPSFEESSSWRRPAALAKPDELDGSQAARS